MHFWLWFYLNANVNVQNIELNSNRNIIVCKQPFLFCTENCVIFPFLDRTDDDRSENRFANEVYVLFCFFLVDFVLNFSFFR